LRTFDRDNRPVRLLDWGLNMSLIIGLWLIAGLAAATGWFMGSFSRKTASIIAAATCLFLVAGTYLSMHPTLLPSAIMYPALLKLYESWFAPPALLILALTFRQSQRGNTRVRFSPLATSAFGAAVLITASVMLLQRHYAFESVAQDLRRPRVDRNGVVRQSTNYTCAAAACATLLRRLDVEPDASERELAPICGTRRNDGAPSLGMAVALNSIAAPKGWNVRLMMPDWDELCRMKMPVVVSVKYSAKRNHALVVCDVNPKRGVLVADPSHGLYWESAETFKRKFNHEAVAVFQGSPYLEFPPTIAMR
jgi:predicted double-glycine peptidase